MNINAIKIDNPIKITRNDLSLSMNYEAVAAATLLN